MLFQISPLNEILIFASFHHLLKSAKNEILSSNKYQHKLFLVCGFLMFLLFLICIL